MLLSHLHFTCAQCFYTGSVLLLLCTLPLIHLMISFFLVDRFDKEQEFTSLQLSVVQSRSLVESLQEFVRGDMLEGDNRYLCGECEEKVSEYALL